MKKTIEFQQSIPGKSELISPWHSPKSPFQDLVLKPEYTYLKAKLPKGTSTLRVLPAIKDSKHWWMPIHALPHTNGQHAHPQTYEPCSQSVFDLARTWLKRHAPEALYDKSTGKGIKLWTNPMAACWLLMTHGGQTKLQLIVASAFAGTTDRQSGLAHQLMQFVQEHPQLIDPEAKCEIEVTRSLPEDSKYLETEFKIIESDRSLNECIADLPAEQIRMVCPVENTIRQIDPDHEWKLLEQTIGVEWTDQIHNSSKPPIT